MKRYTKAFVAKYPHLKGKDIEITRRACEKFKTIPVAVMNFVEGTRFSREKHRQQQSPYKNLLRTKAGGMAFVLSAMSGQLNQVLDVTIVYPEGNRSFWAYLCGNVREIRVRVRSFPISQDLIGDYTDNREFRKRFHDWLNNLWDEKDRCFEQLMHHPVAAGGCQPAAEHIGVFQEGERAA